MRTVEVIQTLENLALDTEQGLDISQVHALYFSVAVIRALPSPMVALVDAILDLEVLPPQA